MLTNTTPRCGLLSEDAMAVDNTVFLDIELALAQVANGEVRDRPSLCSSDNLDKWTRNGSPDTNDRTSVIDTNRLWDYEQQPPPLDDSISEEHERHVIGCRAELGD